MAKLPLIRRVLREDIPDAPEWILPLLNSLNQFFDSVYNALNKNLRFEENIAAQWKTFRILAGVSATDNIFSFTCPLKVKPQGLTVERVVQVEAVYTPVTVAVFCNWRVNADMIVIDAISGLTNGKTYDITVLVK